MLKQNAHRLFFILTLLVSLTSCFESEENTRQVSPAAAPFDPATTPVKWSSSSIGSGIDLKVSTSFTDSFVLADNDGAGRNPIEQMMHVWNESTSQSTFFRTSANTTANKDNPSLASYKDDGEMGIYRSDNWYSGVSSSALAITQYFGIRRNAGTSSEYVELTHADIMLNYRDHSFTLDSSDTSVFDFHTVILHELGHFIGLAHESSIATNAVMLPYLSKSESKRSLASADTNNIRNLYGLSSLTSGSFAQALKVKSAPDEEVRGVIELRENGDCLHYVNGKKVHQHKANLDHHHHH